MSQTNDDPTQVEKINRFTANNAGMTYLGIGFLLASQVGALGEKITLLSAGVFVIIGLFTIFHVTWKDAKDKRGDADAA